jgi:glutamate--cysteine ligase
MLAATRCCWRRRPNETMSILPVARLAEQLQRDAFTPRPAGNGCPPRIGAEIEFIPVDVDTHRRSPIVSTPGMAAPTLPILRRLAYREEWREDPSASCAPVFTMPDGGVLSYEPGGQIEYSAPPSASVSALIAGLRETTRALRDEASASGIDLLAVGLDPFNGIDRVPLQLHGDRYTAMDAYLAACGPAGPRMMRQTAAFQITADAGDDPVGLWQLLSAAAPYVTATFANSSRYAGALTGDRSARAQTWRALDPSRTGLPAATTSTPGAAYTAFALVAPAILRRSADGRYRPFTDLLASGDATLADWGPHLTTLFPEVRPRRSAGTPTFELRSADMVPPELFAAPLVLVAGLAFDAQARRAAADLLGPADPGLLDRAGHEGLRDPAIARVARDLYTLAMHGSARLGEDVVSGADLDAAWDFAAHYLERGRSPADDLELPDAVQAATPPRFADGPHATALG